VATSRLTPHQRNIYGQVLRRSVRASLPGQRLWVPATAVGSRGALAHLEEKGYLERTQKSGPRGGTRYLYRPNELEARVWEHLVHRQTGPSSVRCGAPMRTGHMAKGWDLGDVTIDTGKVTCPACLAP